MDFKALSPVRFTFAFEAPEQARRIPGYTLKQSRKRTALLCEARNVVPHLPGPGEILFAIMTGRYDLMHVLLVIIENKQPVAVEYLRLLTLSYSGRNLAELLRLLDTGKVHHLSLICSSFFARHDRDLFEETLQQFRKRGQKLAAGRTHIKMILMQFADGTKLHLEGSPNLRTNSNLEQIIVANDALVHDARAAWCDKYLASLLASHESNES
jgi:hypothetical protein